jgi:hypothetical protein
LRGTAGHEAALGVKVVQERAEEEIADEGKGQKRGVSRMKDSA